MKKIHESKRIGAIEKEWDNKIKDLFYHWHWKGDLTHREIGFRIGVPRPTITRWFRQFKIPCQSDQRMTKRRWQIRLVKVLKQIKKQRFVFDPPCLANKHFFKTWTPEMAYTLGYFAADGCMFVNPRGSHFIEFTSTDKELIENVKRVMDSRHSIGVKKRENSKWKTAYRIQIGSKKMFNDLLSLGFTPNKSNTIKFPEIPKGYFQDFVRGYFDGDGCVHYGFYRRNDRKNKPIQFRIVASFVSGSEEFLEGLKNALVVAAELQGGSLNKKSKSRGGFQLAFSTNDAKKIFQFIYKGVSRNNFLERKYNKFQKAFETMPT